MRDYILIVTTIISFVSPQGVVALAYKNNTVPFISQAPSGQWIDPLFQNACEEASVVMAMHWVNNTPLSVKGGEQEIRRLALFEEAQYGDFYDRSAKDTAQMIRDYYHYNSVTVRTSIRVQDIRDELAHGHLVIIPADGRKLKNPHFVQPGPITHMLVVTGYDQPTRQFITNDPGTRFGKGYRYSEATLFGAIRDYPTGKHQPITGMSKTMIVISK